MHALLIVEHDFLTNHVGVRRVVFYYWQELVAANYHVTLATPRGGELYIAQSIDLDAVLAASRDSNHNDAPCWSSANPVLVPPPPRSEAADALLVWRDRKVLLDDYDVTIVTAPWLCALGLPEWRYTAGIVYDLVPNLLSCGALNIGLHLDVYEFARQHDIGNKFFLDHVDNICCISKSTREDLLAFYGMDDEPRIKVVMPFKIDPTARIKTTWYDPKRRSRILLVNVLDPRKNFAGVANALKLAMAELAFDVDIVGKERMPVSIVFDLLHDLRDAGLSVEWYAEASDACLATLYANADLLVFPSFYEGLGLPILEAQMHGVPAISSDGSSCGEVNINGELCVDPVDHKLMAEQIISALREPERFITGKPLQRAVAELLKGTNQLPFLRRGSSSAATISGLARSAGVA